MSVDLKKEVREIADIARACPEEFRVKCFEILLNATLYRAGLAGDEPATGSNEGKTPPNGGGNKQFQKFCTEHSISAKALSDVFDFGSPGDFIQVSDFKQTTKAKQQIVLGLLLGVKNLNGTGISTVDDKGLRALCDKHSVLDRPNFASYMKNYKKYFNPAGDGGWKLTPGGLKKAAEVVNSLGGDGGEFRL